MGFKGTKGRHNWLASSICIRFCFTLESTRGCSVRVTWFRIGVTGSNNWGLVDVRDLPTRIPELTGRRSLLDELGKR